MDQDLQKMSVKYCNLVKKMIKTMRILEEQEAYSDFGFNSQIDYLHVKMKGVFSLSKEFFSHFEGEGISLLSFGFDLVFDLPCGRFWDRGNNGQKEDAAGDEKDELSNVLNEVLESGAFENESDLMMSKEEIEHLLSNIGNDYTEKKEQGEEESHGKKQKDDFSDKGTINSRVRFVDFKNSKKN
jgi:hypothetical protein